MIEALSLSLSCSRSRSVAKATTQKHLRQVHRSPLLPSPALNRTARWRLIVTRRSDTVTLHVQEQIFRNVTPCRSASDSQRFGVLCRLHIPGQPVRVKSMKIDHELIALEDTGDIALRNVGSH
jgi:hypothetical protein